MPLFSTPISLELACSAVYTIHDRKSQSFLIPACQCMQYMCFPCSEHARKDVDVITVISIRPWRVPVVRPNCVMEHRRSQLVEHFVVMFFTQSASKRELFSEKKSNRSRNEWDLHWQ